MSPHSELVHLEECDITIKDVICCGVKLHWAVLPDKQPCCEASSHTTRDRAIACAKKRIAKGIALPVPATWPNQEDVI